MKIQNRYKPLLFIGSGVLFLFIFFWLLIQPSAVDKAIKELRGAKDYGQVKSLWIDHKSELSSNIKWIAAVQGQLSNMSLQSQQQEDLSTWFPVKTYLNVVILPDLSGRLVTEPHPIENDKVVIDYIWQAFRESVSKSYRLYGENTKDRLMVDITRERELELKTLASKLIVDCSETQKPTIPYLTGVETSFHQAVDQAYSIGSQQIHGADYYKYINENLNGRRVPSSPFVKYRNIVIILTDGYLETTKDPSKPLVPQIFYTGEPIQLYNLRKGRREKKSWNEILPAQHLPIMNIKPSSPNLKDWEVIILQVYDRDNGDLEILEKLWSDWLTGLGAKWLPGKSFQKYQIAPENNKNIIADFFGIQSSKLSSSTSNQIVTQQETIPKASSDKYEEYENLLAEAEKAVSADDFDKGKLLLRKAAQLKQTAELSTSSKADALSQKYVSFADKAYQTFLDTKTAGLGSIPMHYYELAALIKPGNEIQRKLEACRTNL